MCKIIDPDSSSCSQPKCNCDNGFFLVLFYYRYVEDFPLLQNEWTEESIKNIFSNTQCTEIEKNTDVMEHIDFGLFYYKFYYSWYYLIHNNCQANVK